MDVEVDDTRARKVLGYRNRFSTAQTLRWIVDSIEAADKSAEPLKRNRPTRSASVGTAALPMLNGLADALKKEGTSAETEDKRGKKEL